MGFALQCSWRTENTKLPITPKTEKPREKPIFLRVVFNSSQARVIRSIELLTSISGCTFFLFGIRVVVGGLF